MDMLKLRRYENDLKAALKKAKEAVKDTENVLASDLLDKFQALIDEVENYTLFNLAEMIEHFEDGQDD